MKINRYDWCDALIEAEKDGWLSAGAVNMGLRLATAIFWNPADGRPSGLHWKNSAACESVGVSDRTFYRYRAELVEAGFFEPKGGNLLTQLPDPAKMAEARGKARNESSANVATGVPSRQDGYVNVADGLRQIDTPYSGDICTGDLDSGDLYSEDEPDGSSDYEEYEIGIDDWTSERAGLMDLPPIPTYRSKALDANATKLWLSLRPRLEEMWPGYAMRLKERHRELTDDHLSRIEDLAFDAGWEFGPQDSAIGRFEKARKEVERTSFRVT